MFCRLEIFHKFMFIANFLTVLVINLSKNQIIGVKRIIWRIFITAIFQVCNSDLKILEYCSFSPRDPRGDSLCLKINVLSDPIKHIKFGFSINL